MKEIKTFKQCIEDCGKESKNLLVGNGWSIQFYSKFNYTALLEKLKECRSNKKIVEIFDNLNTSDFERVLCDIEKTKEILDILNPHNNFDPKEELKYLKGSFIEILGDIHPRSWNNIESMNLPLEEIIKLFASENKSIYCEYLEEKAIRFLENFRSYFTINYDLLLYWLLNNSSLKINDGFRKRGDQLTFQENPDQNVFYLHGGLHLYNSATHKRQYENGISIIDSMKKSMDNHSYPTIILEGSSKSKKEAINQSPYLHWCYTKLSGLSGALFIHGFAFKENDAHVYDAVFSNSELKTIFVGLHPNDKDEVKHLVLKINKKSPKNVIFYDSNSIY